MAISVIGLGRLGLPLAAVLAGAGFIVVGADTNPVVLESVRAREPLFYEPGLKELLHTAGDRIALVDDAGVAAYATDASIVLVPTPSSGDGAFDSQYVIAACRSIGEALPAKQTAYHLAVISSTVMPGTCEGEIRQVIEKASGLPIGERWGLCYIPEWVALGRMISDFSEPELVIIGASDERASATAVALYGRLCVNRPLIAETDLITAELAKIAANCYFVTKISFANELAKLCEKFPGADADMLTRAIGLDSRIGRKFFMAGGPAGGRCFPRDLRALLAAGNRVGLHLPLVAAVQQVNRDQYVRIGSVVESCLSDGKVLGLLGLAFKASTDDTTASLGKYLAERFVRYAMVCCDPLVPPIVSAQECADLADVIVVTIPCGEFRGLLFHEGQTVIDCWRLLDRQAVRAAGANYVGIGLGEGA